MRPHLLGAPLLNRVESDRPFRLAGMALRVRVETRINRPSSQRAKRNLVLLLTGSSAHTFRKASDTNCHSSSLASAIPIAEPDIALARLPPIVAPKLCA